MLELIRIHGLMIKEIPEKELYVGMEVQSIGANARTGYIYKISYGEILREEYPADSPLIYIHWYNHPRHWDLVQFADNITCKLTGNILEYRELRKLKEAL